MIDQSNFESFRKKLEEQHNFPTSYLFKFIVPIEKKDEFNALFPDIEFKTRKSKTGRYISLSAKRKVTTADDVIEIYKRAYSIEGIISL